MAIRSDEADIRVVVDGKPYFEGWASYDGGDLVANDAKSRSAGTGKNKSHGGNADRSDITVGIEFDEIVAGYHNELESKVGIGEVAISVQYVYHDRTAIPGAHFTNTGTVKSVNKPKTDINANSTVGMYLLVVSADEDAR